MFEFLSKYKIVFWDFDGVIKESVEVKTNAFRELFRSFGEEVMVKVTTHHINNGGMSRFNKIPIYLTYAGIDPTEKNINDFCNQFAILVENSVVNSNWVPGVLTVINNCKKENQHFVLVTATPQDEIERILTRLNIISLFSNIFGSPMTKSDAINVCLKLYNVNSKESIMIGDSIADFEASQKTGTNFLLRRTPENLISMKHFRGNFINNFIENEK
jgi:phosphoglycolate phosphatase-like HAD superfamily hydrolase